MYTFDNKIIDHKDHHKPDVCEAVVRMSLAWAMQVYPKPPEPTSYQKSLPGWQDKLIYEYLCGLARVAAAMIDSQVWLTKSVKISASDMLGDICHSDNHQNQDVGDIHPGEQWWVIS